MSTKPPRIMTAALVLPVSMVDGELPTSAPIHAKETKEVERRGVDLVMATERTLGRTPVEQAFNNKDSTSCPQMPAVTPTASRSKPDSTVPPTSSSRTTK